MKINFNLRSKRPVPIARQNDHAVKQREAQCEDWEFRQQRVFRTGDHCPGQAERPKSFLCCVTHGASPNGAVCGVAWCSARYSFSVSES